jgi:DNA-binding winged helix-turn-helix (wHTH) protein
VKYSFGEYGLDTDRRELRRGSELVSIGPQGFDVLIYLISNRERVVSKDDLIGAVWRGRTVSDSTLASQINAVRKSIGDTRRRAASNHRSRRCPGRRRVPKL